MMISKMWDKNGKILDEIEGRKINQREWIGVCAGCGLKSAVMCYG